MEHAAYFVENALIEAVIKRDDALFKRLLSVPAARNMPDRAGNTPLHIALDLCCVTYAKQLIENGADFYARNQLGQTPLEKAMQPHLEDILLQMIEHPSFDPNRQDKEGNTLLVGALLKNLNVVSALIKRGADVNLANNQGISPLIAAFLANSAKNLAALKQAGAKADATDKRPMIFAYQTKNEKLEAFLLSNGFPPVLMVDGVKGIKPDVLPRLADKASVEQKDFLTQADFFEHLKAQNAGADVKNEAYIRSCVETFKSWIDKNYMTPLDEDRLAEAFGMKRIDFYHHFKRLENISPLAYRRRCCVEQGRRLIKEAGKTIIEAARLVGYSSPSRFSNDYKKVFGTHPNPQPEAAMPKVHQCIAWIEKHYKEPYDTQKIAQMHNLHATTLITHFRRLKNMLPKVYQMQLRNQEIKRLTQEEKMPFEQAVLAAGYSSFKEYNQAQKLIQRHLSHNPKPNDLTAYLQRESKHVKSRTI